MARIIYRTPPVPMTILSDALDGKTYGGLANFSLILYEPNEEPRPVPDAETARKMIAPVAQWKAIYGSPLIFPPRPPFQGVIPPQLIPDSLLNGLPEGGRLGVRWRFLPSDTWWERDP